MSTSLLIRRGTTAQIDAMAGQPSEPIHNIDNDDLLLGAGKDVVGGKQYVQKTKNASNMGVAETSGNNIQVTLDGTFDYVNGSKFEFIQDDDVLGPVTLSVNNGSNLPVIGADGSTLDLKANTVYVAWKGEDGTAVFTLAPRGEGGGTPPVIIGGISFSHVYDGINAEIKDVDGNDIDVEIGDYIYTEPSSVKIVGSGGTPIPPVDRTTPVSIITAVLDLMGNGSDKIVTLDNGDIIFCARDTNGDNFRVFKSTDDGLTATEIVTLLVDNVNDASLTTDGTIFHCLIAKNFGSTDSIEFYSYDSDGVLQENATIDSNLTLMEKCSMVRADNGDLHACWGCRLSAYPSSTNIRYSVSTDNGANWATVTQVTTTDNSGDDDKTPSIVMMGNGFPQITHIRSYATQSLNIVRGLDFNGSLWLGRNIFNGGSELQANPDTDVKSNGTIVATWEGRDAIDNARSNIRFSQSTDNGVTWSAMEKLTSGNVNAQSSPSIAVNEDDQVSIMWAGVHSSTFDIRLIQGDANSWGTIENLTTDADSQSPNLCKTLRDFEKPISIWQKNNTDLKLYGKWGGGTNVPTQVFPVASSALTGDDIICALAGVLKFNNPTLGDRVTGFKSTTNLID